MRYLCGGCNEKYADENQHSAHECDLVHSLKRKVDIALRDIQRGHQRELDAINELLTEYGIKIDVLERRATFNLKLPAIKDLNDIVSQELTGASIGQIEVDTEPKEHRVCNFPHCDKNASFWFNQAEGLKKENAGLSHRVSHLAECVSRLTVENNSLSEEVTYLKNELKSMTKCFESASNEHIEADSELHEVLAEVGELKAKLYYLQHASPRNERLMNQYEKEKHHGKVPTTPNCS